ncbi:MAG: hypothetical protein IPO21_00925 [Bacteroidales bacterium]|nr:hypothetical protein [Bacteroidales bacterium]
MRKISVELKKFWEWSCLTKYDYMSQDFKLINKKSAEWETDYPFWDKLEDAFKSDIKNMNNFSIREFTEEILLSIAIDNESEGFADILFNILKNNELQIVVEASFDFNNIDVQLQFIPRIKSSCLLDKEKYLKRYAEEGMNDMIKSRAKYFLHR